MATRLGTIPINVHLDEKGIEGRGLVYPVSRRANLRCYDGRAFPNGTGEVHFPRFAVGEIDADVDL